MKEHVSLILPESLSGQRADVAVSSLCPFSPKRAVLKAFEDGIVRTEEGRTVLKGEKLPAGTVLFIECLYEQSDLRVLPEPDSELRVVYEDAALVGVSKRAGQACHPLDFGETGTLAGALLGRYPEMASLGDDPLVPAILHRIDGGTSGLVLAARTKEAYRAVRAQFADQSVVKTYRALVEGRVDRPGAVSGYLAHTYKAGQMRMAVVTPGHHGARALKAETYFRPIGERTGGNTMLEVTIRTGVTHQIRCHLASTGHPIVGDCLYGAPPNPQWAPGTHALHSYAATFVHPLTGKRCTITAPQCGC